VTYFTTYARRSRIRTNNLNVLDIALVKHKKKKEKWLLLKKRECQKKRKDCKTSIESTSLHKSSEEKDSTVFHSLNCSDSSLHTYLTALINVLHGQYQWGVNFSCSFFIFCWHTSMQNLNKEEQICDNVFVAFLW
jgi:hypothetical protein